MADPLLTKVEDAGFGHRAMMVIKLHTDCKTVLDVSKYSIKDLLKFRNTGSITLVEIFDTLSKFGLTLTYSEKPSSKKCKFCKCK